MFEDSETVHDSVEYLGEHRYSSVCYQHMQQKDVPVEQSTSESQVKIEEELTFTLIFLIYHSSMNSDHRSNINTSLII